MNKIAILIDNVRPIYENKLLFEAINKIYGEDKNSSINLFVKNIDWPYKNVEYGVFKWLDYQNFVGDTICTNLELLDYVEELPGTNRLSLYCHDFPFFPAISGKRVLNLLTNPKIRVYCRIGYIKDFMTTFKCPTKICNIEETIRENLYVHP